MRKCLTTSPTTQILLCDSVCRDYFKLGISILILIDHNVLIFVGALLLTQEILETALQLNEDVIKSMVL